MKRAFFGLLAVGLFGFGLLPGANASLRLFDVVLMEDYSELPILEEFPCTAYIDVISCDSFLILEKGCRDTLIFKNNVFSCKSLKGDEHVFGEVDRGSRFEDSTMGGTRGYRVKFSSRVRLQEFVSPNGRREFTLIVD